MQWHPLRFVIFLILLTGLSWGEQSEFRWEAPPYHIFHFENGFSLVVIENHANPLVSTVVVVKAGLRNETPRTNGVSHMLEHMTFNGTTHRTQEALYNELDSLGIYLNAHTDFDYTNYLALSYTRHFPKSVEIMADMLMNSNFPPKKFEKEKGIIIEEVGKDADRPDYQIDLQFQKFLYRGTPYEMPVIGTVESIRNMKRQDVIAYYRQYYQPENMVAIVVGDVQAEKAREIFGKYFGQVKSRKVPASSFSLSHHYPVLKEANNGKFKYVFLAVPAPTLSNAHYPAFKILFNYAFQEKGELLQLIQENSTLDIQDVSVNYELHPEFAFLTFKFRTGMNTRAAAIRRAFIQALEKLGLKGIAEKNVQLVQQNMAISDILDRDQIMYYGFFRSQILAIGGVEVFLKELPAVLSQDAGAVNHLLQNYHRYWNNANQLFQPLTLWEKIPLPALPAQVTRHKREFQQVVKDTLANGLTWVHFRNTDSPVLGIHILFKNRAAWEDSTTIGITDFLHHLYFKGSASSSEAELQQQLQAIGAEVKTYDNAYIPFDDYYNSPAFSYIRFKTIDPFATQAFSLLREAIATPDFSPANVEKVRKQMMGLLQMKNRQASYRGKQGFFQLLYGNHHPLAYPVSGTLQTLAQITPQQLRRFHMQYVSGNNMIVSVVSGLPTSAIKNLIEQAFGGLPRADFIPQFPPLKPTEGSMADTLTLNKQQAMIYWGFLFDDDSLNWDAAVVANSLLSNQLAFHLREEQGLAYRLGSSLQPVENVGQFYVRMGTRPANLQRAISGILQEIKQFASTPPERGAVVRTKNALIASMVRRAATRENQAYLLGYMIFTGRGISDYLNRVKRIERA